MRMHHISMTAALLVACDGDPEDKGPVGGGADSATPPAAVEKVWINEVMAQNQATLQDEAGFYPDWIELWNPNDAAVDLSGWWLSDDRDDPFNWQVPPAITIGPGEYLVVFCDDDEVEGDLHASFHLASLGGEDVALFGPNVLDNPVVDALEDMTVQLADVSLARMPDGGATWSQDDTPTPAASNN